ncbi:MAG TPA: hypothetical protein VFE27_22210 [Acidobacteriaceae bacterium]|nr:hypothetical protein [Acidobacteriaceae bacterium]
MPSWTQRRNRNASVSLLKRRPADRAILLASSLIGFTLILLGLYSAYQPPVRVQAKSDVPSTPAAPAEYVGAEVCATCHRPIYDSFKKTDMGRSMSVITADLPSVPAGHIITVRNERLDRYYDVQSAPAGVYQSEYEKAPDGSEIFRNTQKLAYAIGSGRNGTSYLVTRNGYLYEAPLSFYAKTSSWELSPGFEVADLAFNRPALPGCLVCHSGLALPTGPGLGSYANPPFKELAIGCENCHGPGSLHVAQHRGQIKEIANTRSIINPGRLDPWLADNICMSCHQGRTLRVLQPGKSYADFRPGTPLDHVMAIFAAPQDPKRGSAPISPLLEHFSLMSLSKCYTATKGRMSCLTCHDPHVQPTNTVEYYRQKCLTCHSEQSCRLSLHDRQLKAPSDDCQGCHMPKQPVIGIAHSILTSHRIVRTPDEEFPNDSFIANKLDLGGLIHLDAIPGQPDKVPPLTLLHALGEIGTTDPSYVPSYLQELLSLEKQQSTDPQVLSGLGWIHLAKGPDYDENQANDYLSRAIAAGSTRPEDFLAVSEILIKEGQAADAEKVLLQGKLLLPYDERFYQKLCRLYISTNQYEKALDMLRSSNQLFPEDSFLRLLWQKAEQAGKAPSQ